jgi:hypothetical protein
MKPQSDFYNKLEDSTLSVVTMVSKSKFATNKKSWEEIVQLIDSACESNAQLHLKMRAYHVDIEPGECQTLKDLMCFFGDVLPVIPEQLYLKDIDPDGKNPLAEFRVGCQASTPKLLVVDKCRGRELVEGCVGSI